MVLLPYVSIILVAKILSQLQKGKKMQIPAAF